MYFVVFLAVARLVSAQSTLPVGIDPRCKRMDNDQWEAFPQKEAIRQLAFAHFGLPADRPYTEVLFGHEWKTHLNENWFCAEGWNVVFEPAQELQCNPSTISLIDKSNNAPGIVTINVQSGTKASTTLSETDSSETAKGVSLTMSGSIRLSQERTYTFTKTYTKSYGKEQTFETSTLTSISRWITIGPSNSECTASMTTTTCQHVAKGKYPIIALGWVGWRLKDEFVFKGEKARRLYVFIDSFPRADREGWGTLTAGIASETYTTVTSRCGVCDSTALKHDADRMLLQWSARRRAEIPDNADELQTNEDKVSRAKASLPDHLKDKIMSVGDVLIVPVADDDE